MERSQNHCHISLLWWARNNPCTDSFAGLFLSSFSNWKVFDTSTQQKNIWTGLLAFPVLNLSGILQSSDQLSSKSPFAVGRETTRGLPPESSKGKWLKLKQFTYMIGWRFCLVLLGFTVLPKVKETYQNAFWAQWLPLLTCLLPSKY